MAATLVFGSKIDAWNPKLNLVSEHKRPGISETRVAVEPAGQPPYPCGGRSGRRILWYSLLVDPIARLVALSIKLDPHINLLR